jgi:hypothetical protein
MESLRCGLGPASPAKSFLRANEAVFGFRLSVLGALKLIAEA